VYVVEYKEIDVWILTSKGSEYMILLDQTRNYYNFDLIVKDPKFSRIHPVKQQKTYELVQDLLEEDYKHEITDIIVFGSALTLFCNSYSDIDVVVLGHSEEFNTKLHLYKYGKVDLLGYNKKEFIEQLEDNSFFKNVWERGIKFMSSFLIIAQSDL
jgi:predicted nucleotidyltransferase